MTRFETSVLIERPLEDVFGYVSDPLNFPRWNSAVQDVRASAAGEGAVPSTYVMERTLPTGRAMNELEVIARDEPTEFAILTTSGPTPFVYRYRFSAENGGTAVHLEAEVDLQGPATLLGQLAGRAVKRGVDDNFATLKAILEAPPSAR